MYRVLVVDDELVVRRGIVTGIDWSALDCEVVSEAANGIEGMEAAARYTPDIIITDVRMPQMDGLSMMSELRRRGCRAHAIVLTAYSDFDYARKAIGFGAEEYLLKPFDNDELILAVNKVLQRERTKDGGQMTEALHMPRLAVTGKSHMVMETVRYVEAHYGDHELGIGRIAEALSVSEGHLSHAFKKETGYTVGNYLTLYRMQQAARILREEPGIRIYEVAARAGYRDVTYFSNVFKKYMGKAPTEIRGR